MPHPSPAPLPAEVPTLDTIIGGEPAPDVVSETCEWQVGSAPPPTLLAPAAVRAARLQARLAVYAQYATVVADQAAATARGDSDAYDTLGVARAATAEHFAELRADAGTYTPIMFAEALGDALAGLRHQDAVDATFRHRLLTLREAVARRETGAGAGTDRGAASCVPTSAAMDRRPDCVGTPGAFGALERGWTVARLAIPARCAPPVAPLVSDPDAAAVSASTAHIDLRF